MRKYFTLEDITERIMLTLPVRFTREQSSNVYKFFESLADSFQIDGDKIDELIAQTNLSSASGEYLDQYIQGLIGVGRLKNSVQDVLGTEEDIEISNEVDELFLMPGFGLNRKESDPAYKSRGQYILYDYNSTKQGLKQIVIDFAFKEPTNMYTGSRRGAFYSNEISHAKYFFNDPVQSYYGTYDLQAFTGFIELKERPDEELLEQLCNHIANAKAYGIQIYIKYPLKEYAYNFVEQVDTTDSLSIDSVSDSQNVLVTDVFDYQVITVEIVQLSINFTDNALASESLSRNDTAQSQNVLAVDNLEFIIIYKPQLIELSLAHTSRATDNLSYIIINKVDISDSARAIDSVSYRVYNIALVGSAIIGISNITE